MNVVLHPVPVPDHAARFIAEPLQLLIGGKWMAAKSGKTFDVFDPSTGRAIAKAAEGDAADIDAAVAAARQAFESGPWPRMSPLERGKLIWRLGDALEAQAEEFAALEALDNGKPIRDARAVDVPGSYEMFRYMSGWATRLNGETVPISAPGNWHAYTLREPVGVVGQIIP
jgi:phenylacetaldehyde dehydrogenase